jgi:hypothetical protein
MAGVEPITEKQCTGCCEWLALEQFPLNCRMHLGRSSRCRECHRAATRDWRDRNRERVNAERRAAYRVQHPGSFVTAFSAASRSRDAPTLSSAPRNAGELASSSSGASFIEKRWPSLERQDHLTRLRTGRASVDARRILALSPLSLSKLPLNAALTCGKLGDVRSDGGGVPPKEEVLRFAAFALHSRWP